MDIAQFFEAEFAEHAATVTATRGALGGNFACLVDMAIATINGGGKLMFFGNGGSAADAQHLATELAVRYSKNRKAIAAIALTTDTSALTAIGNDLGFEQLFARQIEAIGRPGDLAIGITTSGRSRNVLLAFDQARAMGISTASLTGNDGGDLPGRADLLLIVPSKVTARIQEMHILLGQMLCGALEQRLGLV
jgi:D-sedoheptulose 7-phosphate isomerase